MEADPSAPTPASEVADAMIEAVRLVRDGAAPQTNMVHVEGKTAETLVKLLDIGFTSALRRPFDLLADWTYLRSARDLLAAGAMAAVAAIAEHQRDKDHKVGSSKMVKSIGKAAATAMGRKLMSDIGAITTAATDAVKKS
mgnify:CR=1 FL=1